MRYDFRTRFGLSFDAAGVEFSWGEAISLMRRLRADVGSHLFAALAGWSWPATYGELIGALHYAAFLAAHTDQKKTRVEVPFPWTEREARAVVSAEERRVAEEYLATRTAIRS